MAAITGNPLSKLDMLHPCALVFSNQAQKRHLQRQPSKKNFIKYVKFILSVMSTFLKDFGIAKEYPLV